MHATHIQSSICIVDSAQSIHIRHIKTLVLLEKKPNKLANDMS